jgi:hypothetical protein
MQRAKNSLTIALIIAGVCAAGTAFSQPAQPLVLPPPPAAIPVLGGVAPMGAMSASNDGRPSAGAAAKAVIIGKADDGLSNSLPEAGTLKELEHLQREAMLSDLRQKIRAASETPGGARAPGSAQPMSGAVAIPMPLPAPKPSAAEMRKQAAKAAQQQKTMLEAEQETPPKANLISVIVTNGNARADLMVGQVVKTVKEGDKLGAWTVATINPGEVTVTRIVTRTATSSTALHTETVEFEKTLTVVLPPQEVAVAAAVNSAPVITVPAGGVAQAVVPPLPAAMKNQDSTAPGGVPPVNAPGVINFTPAPGLASAPNGSTPS